MSLADPSPIFTTPVIPVLTIADAADAVPLARALLGAGLGAIEVTLRTEAAIEAVQAIRADLPDMVVGVGTVLSDADAGRAVAAGAAFLVSPGTPAGLVRALRDAPVPVLPGCATVSEAMALASEGFPLLKFFPAGPSGGARWLKAVSAPLPHVRFCPTGGIDAANAAEYLALPNVSAIGGSWMVPAAALNARDFAAIGQLARDAASLRKRA